MCVFAVLDEEIISLLPPCDLKWQENSNLTKIYSHVGRKREDLILTILFLTQTLSFISSSLFWLKKKKVLFLFYEDKDSIKSQFPLFIARDYLYQVYLNYNVNTRTTILYLNVNS